MTKNILNELIEALGHMQKQGIIHRNLQPEKILLDQDLHIKLFDFEEAKLLGGNSIIESRDEEEECQDVDEDLFSELFKCGSLSKSQLVEDQTLITQHSRSSFIGDSIFLPPELLERNKCGLFTDLYSLGALVYLMLTGNQPNKPLEFPAHLNAAAVDLVEKLMNPKFEKRLTL